MITYIYMFSWVWLRCGDFSRSVPGCGVVGLWSLLRVDPGLNGARCGPMLVTVPNVVWLLVTVLVVAVMFVTTTFASDCLLCHVLPCPRCVWMIHEGGWHSSAGSSSDDQVIWVVWLSSNSKNRENPLSTNNKDGFYWNTFVRQ